MMEKNTKDIAKMFLNTFLKESNKNNILLETCYIVYKSLLNIPLKDNKSYNNALDILKNCVDKGGKNINYISDNEKEILFLFWKVQQLLYIYEKKNLHIQEVSFLSGIVEASLENVNSLNNKETVDTNILEFPKR